MCALILPLGLLPVLIGCHPARNDPASAQLSPGAMAAVTEHPGVPRAALARAIDNLFTDPAVGGTRAILVMHDGRIVGERYAPGYDRNTRMLGWSMAKSVTGVMIGLLVADGRLRLDQPAPVPLWQRPGDPRGEITLRELLQMRSGLRHREEADPVYDADTVRMLFLDGRDDMAAYAEAQPLTAVPGREWRYSTATSVILADIAARALTESSDPNLRRLAVSDYLRARLFEPLGMRSATPEFDAAGTMIGGSMIAATARDWAKFGEFLRNFGVVRGTRILPRSWVQFMTSPAPGNPGYGAQLWLNAAPPGAHDELFPGRAPGTLFAAIGHLGQYVLVSPAQHLTVVRLGKTDSAERAALRGRLGQLVALFRS
ncbi:MAG: beta-lactamase family protein [Pseudomonadota bacterium]|nr:beta-lactamase family protein [Pseudomonadota bacterium]